MAEEAHRGESKAYELIDWILEFATAHDELDLLLTGLSERLLDAGLPLLRASISLPTIDPSSRAVSYIWWRGTRRRDGAHATRQAAGRRISRAA